MRSYHKNVMVILGGIFVIVLCGVLAMGLGIWINDQVGIFWISGAIGLVAFVFPLILAAHLYGRYVIVPVLGVDDNLSLNSSKPEGIE